MYKTLKEASEYIGKSEKTISRYIKRGRLNPERAKSQNGTLEYRFSVDELDTLLEQLEQTDKTGHQTGQNGQDNGFSGTGETRQTGHQTGHAGHTFADEKAFLYEQIQKKDKQIEFLNHQMSAVIVQNASLQKRLAELPSPAQQDTQDRTDKTQRKRIDKSRTAWIIALGAVLAYALYYYMPDIERWITQLQGVLTR